MNNNNGNKTVLTAGSPVISPNGTGNGNSQPNAKSRIHIKKQLGNGVEINVFGDDPESTFALIISTISLCEGDVLPPSPAKDHARQDRLNHEENSKNIEMSLRAQCGNPGGQQGSRVPSVVASELICQICGSNNLKLISWTDKKTGKPVKKWRCQEPNCEAWQKDN